MVLHGGIAIPFPEGKAVAEILEPKARGPPWNVESMLFRFIPPAGRPAWNAVGCLLASEQLFRFEDSMAGRKDQGKIIENKGQNAIENS